MVWRQPERATFMKADLFDNRARVGAALFQYTVRDQQLTAVGGGANFKPLYPLDIGIAEKIETVAQRIYRADGVDYTGTARRDIARLESIGIDREQRGVADAANALRVDLREGAPHAEQHHCAVQWLQRRHRGGRRGRQHGCRVRMEGGWLGCTRPSACVRQNGAGLVPAG